MGVMVENGILKEGTPICVPSKEVSTQIAYYYYCVSNSHFFFVVFGTKFDDKENELSIELSPNHLQI